MTSAKVLAAGVIFLTTAFVSSIIATAQSEAVLESQAVPLVAATAPCNETSNTDLAMSPVLAPRSGRSIRLARFDGIVYYTVEQDGYRVVATLASGAEDLPIRFISTLGPGQRIVISVPQSADQPSVDVEILRDCDALLVSDPVSAVATDLVAGAATGAARGE